MLLVSFQKSMSQTEEHALAYGKFSMLVVPRWHAKAYRASTQDVIGYAALRQLDWKPRGSQEQPAFCNGCTLSLKSAD